MLYFIRIHRGKVPVDVVGPFESMQEAHDRAHLDIGSANDEDWQFSYVSETTRARLYNDVEIMPFTYYC